MGQLGGSIYERRYAKFEKDSDTPTVVRHITRKDVHEAFGEFVIIDD